MRGDFKTMEEKACKINVSELKQHPYNEKIYGANEDVSYLINDILSNGLSMPLIVTEQNVVISGNRRLKACQWLVNNGHTEFASVNCIVRKYEDSDSEIKDIIILNSTRNKNWEQIGREALTLVEIYGKEAEKRMKSGKKSDPMADLPKGSTRDLVADELKKKGINISGKVVDVLTKAISAIDLKEAEGKNIDVFLIRRELTNEKTNFSLLGKLVKNIDLLSEDEKQDLFNDRISLKEFFKKKSTETKNSTDNGTSYTNVDEEFDFKTTNHNSYNSFGFKETNIIDAEFKETERNVFKEANNHFEQLMSCLNELVSDSSDNPQMNIDLKNAILDMAKKLKDVENKVGYKTIKKLA